MQEGVLKFYLRFTPADSLQASELREIGAWRTVLKKLEMVGQDLDRYDGFAFGNLSRTLDAQNQVGQRPFVITGTQTGGVENLGPKGYAVVTECRPEENLVVAHGPTRPSAEALTHGSLYALDPRIHWVFHAHSPEIWRRAEALGIPITPIEATYGSPVLAAAIREVLAVPAAFRQGILSVGGHEDGIFAFGRTAAETGGVLVNALAQALMLE